MTSNNSGVLRPVSHRPSLGQVIGRGVATVVLIAASLLLSAAVLDGFDIDSVEAQSGPQGTLYGASAQAGVLRINTNKPDPTAFDAFVDLGISDTKEGEMSYDVSGMVNILADRRNNGISLDDKI